MAVLLKIVLILKILGIVLLAVFVFALILLLAVLFIPLHYSVSGRIDDEKGSEDPLHLDFKKSAFFEGNAKWFMGALNVRASYRGQSHLEMRIFGVPVPVEKFMRGKKKKEKPERERESAPEEKKSIAERIEEILQKIEKLWERIDDALYVLSTDYAQRAKEKIWRSLLALIDKMLPETWGLTGILGLGDPARSAKVFAVQGILYPVTAGHVAIGTEYELYRYDLQGCARGTVRLYNIVFTGIRILFDRDVRHMIGRLRRGKPSHKYYSNGGQ